MDAHPSFSFLREVLVFLGATALIVPLFTRFRISPILGYLLSGAVLGPYGLPALEGFSWLGISDIERAEFLSELGIIMLLFVIGLELTPEKLWAMRHYVFGLGTAQVVVCGLVLGVIAWHFGNALSASAVIGFCLALSSTAVVIQILAERQCLGSSLGRVSFSILLLQDLAVIPLLLLVNSLAGNGGDGSLPWLVVKISVAAAVFIVGRRVLSRLFRLATRRRQSPELFLAMTLLVIIGAAAAAQTAGLSLALGGFLAGLMLSESEYRYEIEVIVEPFKGLLLGLFFLSIGMSMNFPLIQEKPLLYGMSAVGLILVKATLIAALCLLFRLVLPVAVEVGLLLGQSGEFALIAISLAAALGVVPPETRQFVMIVTSLSLMLTPVVAALARRLAARLERPGDEDGESLGAYEGMRDHIIIAGFGRVGQTVADVLKARGESFLAVDLDSACVKTLYRKGLPVFYGDASRHEMLNHLSAGKASAVLITMDDADAILKTLRAVRREWPHLPVLVRARDAAHAAHLLENGATQAILETMEASLQLSARTLEILGVPHDVAALTISRKREEALTTL